MEPVLNPKFPSIEALRARARRRMPGFAFDYIEGGCNSNINLARNTDEIREVRLHPTYIGAYPGADQRTELFGETYDAPFGIAPIGLQGLVWPRSCEILASAAAEQNIPFCLSTVGTASIEKVAELTSGRAWFQLYHPTQDALRDKLLSRVKEVGLPVLVLLADTPVFGYRPREIRNGLSIPPQMSLRNVAQMMMHPAWSLGQLAAGAPEFATMKDYVPPGLDLKHLGLFMDRTFSGRLTEDRIKVIRDLWPGKLVVKGVVHEEDAEKVIALGADGMICSNHGGRQLDAGEASIRPMSRLAKKFGDKITVMHDSGIRTGPDIACSLASGAQFTFLGRSFMYGVAAMGAAGGLHTILMLKRQLQQIMEQLACARVADFPDHLVDD